jgi:hypothetical protein
MEAHTVFLGIKKGSYVSRPEIIWDLKYSIVSLFFGEFAEFDKNAIGRLGMDESNFRIVSTRSGFLIDHGRSLFQKGSHFSFDIFDFKTDMVDALALGF